jgi:lysophospholipase L1-like esterase
MNKRLKTFLALGDSYTIGESIPLEESWPYQLINFLNKNEIVIDRPQILATTGWRTDDLIRAIANSRFESRYDFVSLLIGVNNQYQHKPIAEYEIHFSQLLNTALSLTYSKEHVFVLSIPDYGFTPFGDNNQLTISREIDLFNTVNERITRDSGVEYINITDISRKGMEDPSLVAPDGLHPSAKMYRLWAEEILLRFRGIKQF